MEIRAKILRTPKYFSRPYTYDKYIIHWWPAYFKPTCSVVRVSSGLAWVWYVLLQL